MSNPIIKVKRATTEGGRFSVSTGATSVLNHGELAVIFPNPLSNTPSSLGETIYIGDEYGRAVAVGGKGTFATRQYVDDKVTSVFVYKGKITSFFPLGSAAFPLDLDTTLSQVTGSYYSIDSDYPGNPNNDDPGAVGTDKNAVGIAWTEGGVGKTLLVKLGDSIVKTATGWEKFDNVDVVVHETATETAITGDENTGYTVGLATEFKNRVSDLEDKTQNIDLTGTIAGVTQINDSVVVQGANAEFTLKSTSGTTNVISAKDGNITLGGAITGGQIAVRTEKFVVQEPTTGGQVWEINEYGAASNKLPAQSDKSSFNLDMDGNVTLGAEVANTSVKAQGAFIVSAAGVYAPNFTVESMYGSGAANALLNVDGTASAVSLGGNWPSTEVKVRSTKLVGVDGTFGTPAIENFIIDGGNF